MTVLTVAAAPEAAPEAAPGAGPEAGPEAAPGAGPGAGPGPGWARTGGGGLLVVLRGRLGPAELAGVRAALLGPRAAGGCEVVVDAAEVEACGEECLAVLLAAAVWVADSGGRLSIRRASPQLLASLEGAGLGGLLPVQPAPAAS